MTNKLKVGDLVKLTSGTCGCHGTLDHMDRVGVVVAVKANSNICEIVEVQWIRTEFNDDVLRKTYYSEDLDKLNG